MKKHLLIVTLLFVGFSKLNSVNAQKYANWWYFGNNAGMDFSAGSPIPVAGGQTATTEGCASIADLNGNLLFYSDGVNIWNKNHVVMPNGSGLTGNGSSTQSALIVLMPGSSNLYYVFTTGSGTFDYSIVDMTLAGGNGDVTAKNVNMTNNSGERATAIRMANGIDFWIVGHEVTGNTFFAFQLTSAGVSAVPVLSSVGTAQGGGGDEIGYLKTNPDGTKLAMAVRYKNIFEIFDFNKTTGDITNPITFPSTYPYAYGVEFSPDGSKLYMSGGLGGGYIYQVDMNAGNAAAIIASATLVANSNIAGYMWALQTGPDCKIYAAKYQEAFLGVINNPNDPVATCNYVDNQFALTSGLSTLGLPNFFEMTSCAVFNIDPACLGDSTYFTIGNVSSLAGVQWNFGDTASGANNYSSVFNPVHYYASVGTYTVQLITYNFFGTSDTNYAQVEILAIPVVSLGNDTSICIGSTLVLDADTGFASYLWQDGSVNQTFAVTDSGYYVVTVSNAACSANDSIYVSTITCAQPVISMAASDTSFCEKNCIDFFDLSTNNPTSWQWFFPGADSTSSNVQNPSGICYNSLGSFDVTLIACNSNGCDTLVLYNFINEYPNPTDSIWGANDTLFSLPANSYQWYEVTNGLISGAINQYYIPTSLGNYYCVITDSIGCVGTSNIVGLTANPLPITIGTEGGVFAITPNPNDGNFEINFSFVSQGSVSIYDAVGQIVFNTSLTNHHSLITTYLSDGIYFVEVKAGEKIYRKKMVVKR